MEYYTAVQMDEAALIYVALKYIIEGKKESAELCI